MIQRTTSPTSGMATRRFLTIGALEAPFLYMARTWPALRTLRCFAVVFSTPLARHVLQDGFPARAVAYTYVFCRVFFRRRFEDQPEAVQAISKRTDTFSASRWILSICHMQYWLLAVIDGVPGLKARFAATSRGNHVPPTLTATLAVLNSAPDARSAAAFVSVLQNWVGAVAITEGLGASMSQAAARRWVTNCIVQASPPAPRQSPGSNDSSVFVLSFMSCLSTSDDDGCKVLLSSGSDAGPYGQVSGRCTHGRKS